MLLFSSQLTFNSRRVFDFIFNHFNSRPRMPLSNATILAQFNAIVRNTLPSLSAATWYEGVHPRVPGNTQLGARTETSQAAASLGLGTYDHIVFNVLHGFAMELTRVRLSESWFRTDGAPIYDGQALTALNPGLALYFAIPGGQPTPANETTLANLNNFLTLLRSQVVDRRTSAAYVHRMVTCHSSCHGNCHGSRGRR